MKTQRININYQPLGIAKYLDVVGATPAEQQYDGVVGEYLPDYSLSPLTIRPNVVATCNDNDPTALRGNVTSLLANPTWTYMVRNGESIIKPEQTITTSTPGFIVSATGGKIQILDNLHPGDVMTLKFTASLVDTRMGQIHEVMMTQTVRCTNIDLKKTLHVDAADHTLFNPLEHEPIQAITATLRDGNDIDPSFYDVVWQRMDESGQWVNIGNDELDYAFEVSADTRTLTVDRSIMGESVNIRAYARYDADGDFSDVDDSDPGALPHKVITISRKLPKFDYDILSLPSSIPSGLGKVAARAVVKSAKGSISNADTEFSAQWYVKTNNHGIVNLTASNMVAEGFTAELPTSAITGEHGEIVGLEVVDKGAWKALTDNNGNILTDENNNIILIR